MAAVSERGAASDLAATRRILLRSWTNVLLIFVPLAVALELTHAPHVWLFIASGLAIVPLAAYAAGLFFSLHTHRDVFRAEEPTSGVDDESAGPVHAADMTKWGAVVLLAVATALTAVAAEILVSSVELFAEGLHLSDLFVGMIVIAIVGNAAEHWSAVIIARDGNMQLAMNIAKSSSVQIALL